MGRPSLAAVLGLAALGAAAPGVVHANGAFPDAQSVLTPADRPGQIIMATNFGVILSEDAGATWLWSCETEGNTYGTLYQLAPPPRDRLFTLANLTLAYSDDGTCSWQTARGALAELPVTDAYVDPGRADHVLAIGAPGSLYSLFESTDGGATFGPPLYTAPEDIAIQGVELAQSDPLTIYLAMTSSAATPLLARSIDGGAHFTVSDLSADLGPGWLRIIAVDPEDPTRVLLRFLGLNDQSLVLTTDGGQRASKTVTVSGNFTSFVRLPSGTMLVGAMVEGATVPALFRSRDRGASFETLANAPSIRALSQRDGVVYAAADNFGDGFALGTSVDEGQTWQALFRYDQVRGVLPCLSSRCQPDCQAKVDIGLWPQAVCSAAVTGGGPPAGGCGCGVTAGSATAPDAVALVALAVLAAIAAAARRGSGASGCNRSSSGSASPARRCWTGRSPE
jgi:MYXO-CTERM domain-containing protein